MMIKKTVMLFAVIYFVNIFSYSVIHAQATVNPSGSKISINLAASELKLIKNGEIIYAFPVAVGKITTPTPMGLFYVDEKEVNPEWLDPKDKTKKADGASPDNPLGYRWIGLNREYYGIHGTNAPWAIGEFVSNGCIRMFEEDVELLYDQVTIGTPVEIYYERVILLCDENGYWGLAVYPDPYGCQYVDVNTVNKLLTQKDLAAYVEDELISELIENSNGEMASIGRFYPMEINDKWVSGKLMERDGQHYVPAKSLEAVLKIKTAFDDDTNVLTTLYGEAPAMKIKNNILITLQDAAKLFAVRGELQNNNKLLLKSIDKDAVQ